MGIHKIRFYSILTILFISTTVLSAQNRSVVIYQEGQVLFHDVRSVNLNRGSQEILMEGFSDTFDFGSVMVHFDGKLHDLRYSTTKPIGFWEQMDQLKGKEVYFSHHTGSSFKGTLISHTNGSILVRLEDGSHTLIPDYKTYTFNSPHFSVDKPKSGLALTLEPSKSGQQDVELTYLASGLNWGNEYVLILDENDKNASLNGWSMITNRTESDFNDLNVHLIAGSLNRASRPNRPNLQFEMALSSANRVSDSYSAKDVSAEVFGDMHLFTLPGTTSIKAGEQRRIPIIETEKVTTTKRYRYTSQDQNHEYALGGLVRIEYEVTNTEKNNLGKAIPTGVVKVYRMNGELPVLIGEDNISNVPKDGMISVTSGMAFDILIKENLISQTRISDKVYEQTSEIMIQNRKDEALEIEVERFLNPNQEIIRSGQPFESKSARNHTAKFNIPAGTDLTFQFTIRTSN
ncbi:MAG TPA: hypothetical protein DCE78_06795 [Bacteroidetes bacterium]|nr:hypothetical protein [Bacteroidota bacterium]